jgi:tripartite-type tricarboxylate transporter receptor subunit TctC
MKDARLNAFAYGWRYRTSPEGTREPKPDGYTFLFGAGSQLVLAPLLQKVGYDPDKDLIPITEFRTGPQILGVKGDMPVNTLQEFIDYAKARPGKLTYAGSASRP